ncbi:hypothetical protein K488DRAFT_51257, partial [Vararia minispora EC-137]
QIDCGSRWCRFSSVHPATCKWPECNKTCLQQRGYPQHYNPHVNAYCPDCQARGFR